MTQLEMEVEIDRQLALGMSGADQMNLAKNYKAIPVDEYEEKYGAINTRKIKRRDAMKEVQSRMDADACSATDRVISRRMFAELVMTDIEKSWLEKD
jgi:hypothetical protein